MRKAKKTLLAAACACALVVGSVAGTVAYLTSQDSVTNTFTVGNVAITLDEAKVNDMGQKLNQSNAVASGNDELAARVDANSYKLLPGHEYVKDPIVHFAAGSEASWLFVKVENGISSYESTATGYSSIAAQITINGWTALDGVNNVYYKQVEANDSTSAIDHPVFAGFAISEAANKVSGWVNANAENTKVVVTAYAVQKDGFSTAKDAWDATFGVPAVPVE